MSGHLLRQEHQKLSKTYRFDGLERDIESMEAILHDARNRLSDNKCIGQQVMEICSKAQKDSEICKKRVHESEKEVHSGLSKYSKAMDKAFKGSACHDISGGAGSSQPELYPKDKEKLARAISMHLCREGLFDVSESVQHEAGLDDSEDGDVNRPEFVKLNEIVTELQENHNVNPAISWVKAHQLKRLEFSLHRLEFLKLLSENPSPVIALEYAQRNLAPFGEPYLKSISQLMCGLCFQSSQVASPYQDMTSQQEWRKVSNEFSQAYCLSYGFSTESPLYTTVMAGSMALPTLLKVATIMKAKRTEWTSDNELPVELPLPDIFHFHPIFVCPVSKEQTTSTNLPRMMPCGHVIATESLNRLCRGNSKQRFKCPYCPNESTSLQSTVLYFE